MVKQVLTTLRTHWKKSIFFGCASIYGANYARIKYHENVLMRTICREASLYGQMALPVSAEPYNVTVILNPAADKGGARKKFEKYCAPVLNLAGIRLSVIRTEGEGEAKGIMEIMKDADAVLVAGGDGTLMEAITGLMRRQDADMFSRTIPIGILPVGKNNYLAKSLFPETAATGISDVAVMATSAMACVKQLYRAMDVMQVENVSEDEDFRGKKLYAMREFQIGALRDAGSRQSKYWYFAGLKKYMTYVFGFTTAAKELLWNVESRMRTGLTEIVPITKEEQESQKQKQNANASWYSYFRGAGSSASNNEATTRAVDKWSEFADYNGVDISITTPSVAPLSKEISPDRKLEVIRGPREMTFTEFVAEGYARENEHRAERTSRLVKTKADDDEWRVELADAVTFVPGDSVDMKRTEGNEKHFSLDNEAIEVRGPVEVRLLKDRIVMFCGEEAHINPSGNQPQNSQNQKWWQKKSGFQQNLIQQRNKLA